jgi:hypothetical protein
LAALAVKSPCLFLLSRHRSDDTNMSRPGLVAELSIANGAEIAVAGLVALTGALLRRSPPVRGKFLKKPVAAYLPPLPTRVYPPRLGDAALSCGGFPRAAASVSERLARREGPARRLLWTSR